MHTIRKTDESWQVGYYNLAEWETVIDVALGHWELAARWTNYLNGGSAGMPDINRDGGRERGSGMEEILCE